MARDNKHKNNGSPLLLMLVLALAGGIYYYSQNPGEASALVGQLGLEIPQVDLDFRAQVLGDKVEYTMQDIVGESIEITLSEEQLNKMADDSVEGIGSMGVSITSAEVDVSEGKLTLDISVSNGIEVEVISKTKNKGTGIKITSIDMGSEGMFASTKEDLLKSFAQKIIDETIEQNKDFFSYIKFVEDGVVIAVKTDVLE